MQSLTQSVPSSWMTSTPPEWVNSYVYNLVSDRFEVKIKDFIRIFKSPIEEKWENYVMLHIRLAQGKKVYKPADLNKD